MHLHLRRVLAILSVAMLADLAVVAGRSTVAAASSCPSYQETHVAWQWTATSSVFYHTGTGLNPLPGAYYGWAGIDGGIQFPSHVPNLGSDGNCAHSLGLLGVVFDDTPGPLGQPSFINTGWYTGCFILNNPPTCRFNSLGAYVEAYNAPANLYIAPDIAPVSPGTTPVFRVEYDPVAGCYNAYWNYNTFTRQLCRLSSGAMYIGSEVHTHISGTLVEMPTTIYGSANPNTNYGLRINGANGYVVWDTNLSSYTTSWYDERGGGNCSAKPSCTYWISEFNMNYEFEGYGETTG